MKKLLSFVLALALALSFSVTAFAAGEDTDTGTTSQGTTIKADSTDKTGSTNVNYTVDPAYIVTIPASVTINGTNNSNTVTVSAEDVKVKYGKQVVVKLTGINVTDGNENGDSEFKVKTNEGAALTYTVKDTSNNTITLTNNTVLTVNPASTTATEVAKGSTRLTFALATDAVVQYAGTYIGTVTFTVVLEDVPTTP